MLLIGWGKHRDARTPDLKKDAVGIGFRFQGAFQGLSSAVQAAVLTRLGGGHVQMSDLTPE